MPQIIPIRDLKNTDELSRMCRDLDEPIFVTENGSSEMVIMSVETYERTMFISDVYRKLEEGEKSIRLGDVIDAFDSLRSIKVSHEL